MADWQPLANALFGLLGIVIGSPLALAVYKRRDDKRRDETHLIALVQEVSRDQINDYRVTVTWQESVIYGMDGYIDVLVRVLREAGLDVPPKPPRPPRPVMMQKVADSDDRA